jgi:hypothetical protein
LRLVYGTSNGSGAAVGTGPAVVECSGSRRQIRKTWLIGDQTRPLLAEAMVSEGLGGQMRDGDGRGEGERDVVRVHAQ